MIKEPKVTVGLCVKNSENTIKETIQSVLAQDFPRDLIELLIVDGCSSDRTIEIIGNCLLGSDMRYEIMKESHGLGFARQIVIENARGDYVLWVDGDVTLARDHIRKQVEFMEQNSRVGIAAAKHTICPDGSLVSVLEDVPYMAVDADYCGKAHSKLPGTAGSICRVKAMKQAGGFDVSLTGVGEDIEAAWRVRNRNWIVCRGTEATFFERRKETWRGLWDHYFWYGYGGYQVTRKNSHVIKPYEMTPIAGLMAGIWYSIIAYKLMPQKRFFLLPFHYFFKRTAWCLGFLKAYFGSSQNG